MLYPSSGIQSSRTSTAWVPDWRCREFIKCMFKSEYISYKFVCPRICLSSVPAKRFFICVPAITIRRSLNNESLHLLTFVSRMSICPDWQLANLYWLLAKWATEVASIEFATDLEPRALNDPDWKADWELGQPDAIYANCMSFSTWGT